MSLVGRSVELPLTHIHKQRKRNDQYKPLSTGISSSSPSPSSSSTTTTTCNVSTLNQARRVLYFSHTLAQFADVTWQFSIIIFVSALTNYSSLFFVSSYGIASGVLVLICNSSVLGNFIDSVSITRSSVMTTLLVTQLTCVIITTATIYFLFLHVQQLYRKVSSEETLTRIEDPHILMSDMYFIVLILGLHVFGGLAKALDKGVTVALEKDWIVVMSQQLISIPDEEEDDQGTVIYSETSNIDGNHTSDICRDDDGLIGTKQGDESSCEGIHDDNSVDIKLQRSEVLPSSTTLHVTAKSWLTETNVIMKQIDLGCKLVGPAISGFVLDSLDKMNKASCPGMNILNMTSIDDNITSMAIGSSGSSISCHMRSLSYAALLVGCVEACSLIIEYLCTQRIYRLVPSLSEKLQIVLSDEESECRGRESTFVQQLYYNLRIYLRQPIMLGGLSLSLLYLNVLTFGGLMTAYLVAQGMSLHSVGIWRGLAATIGLLGTIIYPISVRRIGIIITGLWGILAQFLFLSVSFVSLLFKSSIEDMVSVDKFSIMILVLGVCASRIGLYVFDISINQLIQLNTSDDFRGVVGTVQESLNALFDIQNYIIGIFISDISGFQYLVAIGYSCVGLALACYVRGVFLRNDLCDR